jgi:predicted amidophosphoribosyltransferase
MSLPRTMGCRECGRDSLDLRWSPLCPACYKSLNQEQRRQQVRPPALEDVASLVRSREPRG